MIEILKTCTDPQISKGVDALKQLLFLKKRRIRFPVVVPASKIACGLNPAHGPGGTGILLIPPLPGDNMLLNVCLIPE